MTLILTELSEAGIAMAADSAISMLVNKKIVVKDQKQWRKLLPVPRIKAGISYWGEIGRITSIRFDEWLEWRINNGPYKDLRSFADYLAGEMNHAVGDKPLFENQQAGIHVAGFQPWADGGMPKPTFYHIHNGHSRVVYQLKTATINGQTVILETVPTWNMMDSRELFTAHDDFSPKTQKPDALSGGKSHLTRNGDYAGFAIIFDHLMPLVTHLNTIPGFSIPGKLNELEPRLRFLKSLIEITINIYKCSSVPRHIGGKVLALGIRPDGSYLGKQ
jgi:hypothetical protein